MVDGRYAIVSCVETVNFDLWLFNVLSGGPSLLGSVVEI